MTTETTNQTRGPIVNRRTALATTAIAGASLAVAGTAYLDDDRPDLAQTSAEISGRGRMPGYFPNVELVTHRGERVRFYDDLVRDKSVLFTLMYLGCDDYCPLTTANLLRVQKLMGNRIGRDVFFYGLTLDPILDTPELLNAYANDIGAGDGFTFLTGEPDNIEIVRRKLGLFDPDPVVDADRSAHGAMAVYGNEPKGRWCGMPALIKPERVAYRLHRVMDA